MPDVRKKIISEKRRTYIIKVYNYAHKVLTGTFQNAEEKEVYSFDSFTQLVLQIEHFMDGYNYPQASFQNRYFEETIEPVKPIHKNEMPLPKNAMATFTVKILFRQSASWQGFVGWEEKNKQKTFRSILELAKLIDNALSGIHH